MIYNLEPIFETWLKQPLQMIFENQAIDISYLPAIDELSFDRPAPAYWKVSMYTSAIFASILLIGSGLFAYFYEFSFLFNAIGMGLLLLFIAFLLWVTHKGYYMQGYALRQKDVVYKKGIFFQSTTSIPFNRVQHCEIKQGPIERIFGLKSLEIYTAGGHSSDLRIAGLEGEKAQQLKEFIIRNTATDGSEEE